MSHDHIGIPRFLEQGFANDGKVYCHDLVRDKGYQALITRLGTQSNYYDDDVEKTILADDVEADFAEFYNSFCGSKSHKGMFWALWFNIATIKRFFRFMFMRSKKILAMINDRSVSSKVFGDMDHSELLRIAKDMIVDPFLLAGPMYSLYLVENQSKEFFINNSIGFCIITGCNGKNNSIFMPLNNKRGILVSSDDYYKQSLFVVFADDAEVNSLNRRICMNECQIGNDFIFGNNEQLLNPYIGFTRNLKKKVASHSHSSTLPIAEDK